MAAHAQNAMDCFMERMRATIFLARASLSLLVRAVECQARKAAATVLCVQIPWMFATTARCRMSSAVVSRQPRKDRVAPAKRMRQTNERTRARCTLNRTTAACHPSNADDNDRLSHLRRSLSTFVRCVRRTATASRHPLRALYADPRISRTANSTALSLAASMASVCVCHNSKALATSRYRHIRTNRSAFCRVARINAD